MNYNSCTIKYLPCEFIEFVTAVKGPNSAEHSSYLKRITFHVLHGTIQTNLLPKLRLQSLKMWCQVEWLRHNVTNQNTVILQLRCKHLFIFHFFSTSMGGPETAIQLLSELSTEH